MKNESTASDVVELNPRMNTLYHGARAINESLDDTTILALKPMVINWLVSPQMLCVMSNHELDYLHEAIMEETAYRRSIRRQA